MNLLQKTIEGIPAELNYLAMEKAQEHIDNLLKPQGSLGRMEDLIVKLAGIQGEVKPKINKKAIIMMCADNGVYEEGYHAYPQEVTKLIAELSGEKGIVASSVFSRALNAEMITVDIGINKDVEAGHIIKKKIRYGTGNIAKEQAMSKEEAIKAIEIGIEVTTKVIKEGCNLIGVGEAGICNTATSAAMLSVLTGVEPREVVGRGSGLVDEKLEQKIKIVEKAISVNKPEKNDPLDVLSKVGGLEIAAMTGCFLAAARESVPVVIDGFISGLAALTALRLNPNIKNFMFPSHYSAEPGAKKLLQALDIEPYLNMNMRLGEGTGALLAFSIFDCAVQVMQEMGTFSDL